MKTKGLILALISVLIMSLSSCISKATQDMTETTIRKGIPKCVKVQKFYDKETFRYYFVSIDSTNNICLFDELGRKLTTFEKIQIEVEQKIKY